MHPVWALPHTDTHAFLSDTIPQYMIVTSSYYAMPYSNETRKTFTQIIIASPSNSPTYMGAFGGYSQSKERIWKSLGQRGYFTHAMVHMAPL